MSALLTPPPVGPSTDFDIMESLGLPSVIGAPQSDLHPPDIMGSMGLPSLLDSAPQPQPIAAEFMPLAEVPPENKLGQSIQNWRGIHQNYGGSGASPQDAQYWIERVPFAGTVGTAVNLTLVKKAMDRIQSNEGTDDDYSRLGQFIAEEEAKSAPKGVMRTAGDILSAVPGFAFEFWAGGGLAKGAIGAGAKALGKEVAEKAATTAVTGGIKAGATEAAKAAGFEAVRTAFMPQQIAASATRRMIDEFKLTPDEAGRVDFEVTKSGDGIVKAIGKGALDTYIESLTERSGAATVGAFNKAVGIGYGKTFGHTGPGRALSDFVMRKWIAAAPGRTPGMFTKALREVGQDGIIGELVEERMGEVARGATGLEEGFGATGGLLSGGERREAALKQLAAEAAAFAIPGAPGIASGAKSSYQFATTPAGELKQFTSSGFTPAAEPPPAAPEAPPAPPQTPPVAEVVPTPEAPPESQPAPPAPPVEPIPEAELPFKVGETVLFGEAGSPVVFKGVEGDMAVVDFKTTSGKVVENRVNLGELRAADSGGSERLGTVSKQTEAETPEPAPKPGHVRVYHSGDEKIEGARWVSTSKEYASNYRPNLPLHYLDVPENDPRVNDPDYPDQGVKQGFTFNFELSPEESARLTRIERSKPEQTPTPIEVPAEPIPTPPAALEAELAGDFTKAAEAYRQATPLEPGSTVAGPFKGERKVEAVAERKGVPSARIKGKWYPQGELVWIESVQKGARRGTPEGIARLEAAKELARNEINNPDLVGKQRADRIANLRNLVGFLEANADTTKPLDTDYRNGDQVAYTGVINDDGFREFIYLEGARAGEYGQAMTEAEKSAVQKRKMDTEAEQQKEFARLHKPAEQSRVYRETSLDYAEEFLPNSNTSTGAPFGAPDLFVSDNPDLAIGQGENRGVVLEFDTAGLDLKEHKKPGTEVPGVGKEYVVKKSPSSMRGNLVSVTIKPEAQGSRAMTMRTNRFLKQLVNQGWKKDELPGGSVKYTRPESPPVNVATETPLQFPDNVETPQPRKTLPQREAAEREAVERIRQIEAETPLTTLDGTNKADAAIREIAERHGDDPQRLRNAVLWTMKPHPAEQTTADLPKEPEPKKPTRNPQAGPVIKILKKYGTSSGRRFAAVEVDGERIDVVTRESRKDSEETRAAEIKKMAVEQLQKRKAKPADTEPPEISHGSIPDDTPEISHSIAEPPEAPAVERDAPESTEPETDSGKKLLDKFKADAKKPGKKTVGPRSIMEYLNDLLRSKMLVGRTQTTGKRPAHYQASRHIIRSRSGNWELDFHEFGHVLSGLLADKNGKWFRSMNPELTALTQMKGSHASAQTPEEGIAEWMRRYIVAPETLPDSLNTKVENRIRQLAPDILTGIKDAKRAYDYWLSRPMMEQLQTLQNDHGPKPSIGASAVDLMYRGLTTIVGGGPVLHRLRRRFFEGIGGTTRASFDKTIQSQQALAREVFKQIEDTPADFESAYQSTMHIPQEVQRALYGVKHGREGIRIRATGDGFSRFDSETIDALREAGFHIPDDDSRHGNWIYLSDRSISSIKHAVGLENWDDFTTYGQYRAAIARYDAKDHRFPGWGNQKRPNAIRKMLREQERLHPDWDKAFKDINAYMDQLLLIPVLSGEIEVGEAITIKSAYQDYWPLPRQQEDRATRKSGSGPEPSSGIRRAFGSEAPFLSLDEAIETRTRMAYDAYYTNRMMQAVKSFGEALGGNRKLPFDVRKDALRLMLPLNLEIQKVASLTDEEQRKIVADAINARTAFDNDMEDSELDDELKIDPDDIIISTPGRPVWRYRKPNAVHVIATFEPGKGKKYYQVPDPLMFDLLSRGKDMNKYLGYVARAASAALAPWKRVITQNIPFALGNALSRDPMNAAFTGKDTKSLIPYFYATVALVNRAKGGNLDVVSESELLSKALDYTTRDSHGNIVDSFLNMLKEGIALPGYSEMTFADRIAEAPGQVMSTVMKPLDIINWITGGRWLSQFGEKLSREGAYITALRNGYSEERAQKDYDEITGNFGQKTSNQAVASLVRTAGFLNPAIQIAWGQANRIFDPDPKVRAYYLGAKLPALAAWGAVGAAINYAMIAAMNDDDEFKKLTDEMKERKDEDRLSYMALWGKIRMPFDYGIIGSAFSYGWNSVEQRLLDDPIAGKKMASELLSRSGNLPTPIDAVHPYAKVGAELWINHSFFTDKDIVPSWMEEKYPYNPELQSFPDTPGAYKSIGRSLGVSPIKIEYAVRNILTRMADDFVSAADRAATGQPVLGEEAADAPIVGKMAQREPRAFRSESVSSLKEMDQEFTSIKNKLKDLEERGGDQKEIEEAKTKLSKLSQAHHAMTELDKTWDQAKDARNKGRMEEMRTKEREMTKLARAFIDAANESDNPFGKDAFQKHPDMKPLRDGYIVSLTDNLTEHAQWRRGAEPIEKFQARRDKLDTDRAFAAKELKRIGVDAAEAINLLAEKNRAGGRKLSLESRRRIIGELR